MPEIERYWLKDKTAPFAVFLNFLEKYYHPEIRYDNFEALIRRAKADREDDADLAVFKQEFVRLIKGDREGLHPLALSTAAEYDERNDDEFLATLWRQLYPGAVPPS
ncbi:hypothetical protein AB0P21_32785 [Kribbella sp. NPDC056861]|uniref:hypothetical protein n=1 Tax=Kribbella sp. NPDC056861 TaxID=3154857 RepID=UPI003445DF28